jgi:uncharacterized membrane protein YhaH (DUF805 family)
MKAYLHGYRRAFDFSGRSTRSEFWLFVLFGTLAVIVASLVDVLVFRETQSTWLATVLSLVQIVPSISVGVRRLHDTGRSGWWYLVGLVPLIGAIVLLVMLCGRSAPDRTGGQRPQRSGRGNRSARQAAAAGGLGVMIAEAGEVAASAAELVTVDADDGDDDGPDFDPD